MSFLKKNKLNKGYLLIQVLVFGAVAVIIVGGLISFASANIRLGRRVVLSEKAFQIAESGIEYYRWHLAHDPDDYTDGTGLPGPYVKEFYNKEGELIGTFTLEIVEPSLGSTLVTVISTGSPVEDTNITRTILSRMAIPSFANFALITDSDMRFGSGTEVFGPSHSNGGIRFDGLAHNIITSTLSNYDDPDHGGGNEFGVHTHVNAPPGSGINNSFRPLEAPPNPVQSREDVFLAGRSFPVPEIPFGNITSDLEDIHTAAVADGFHMEASGDEGYLVILREDDSFDLYEVDDLEDVPVGCSPVGQPGWGSWTIDGTTFIDNYSFPENGLIFLEDHVWVQGIIDGARLTIVAANIPDDDDDDRKSMTINHDIEYTNHDGTDVIALIGQDNVNVGLESEDDLIIDAALVAENGRVGRYYYEDDCSPYDERDTITLYGTIITALRYGFAYGDGTGYEFRNLIYDSFLLYNPPPFFPQTEDFHQIIFWKEI